MGKFQVVAPDEGNVISLPLATIAVKSTDADLAEGRIVGELTAEPGFSGPGPHHHSGQAELFYVLDGEFTFQVEGEEILLRPGMSLIISPDTIHNFANASANPAKLLVIGAAEEIGLYSTVN